MGKTQLFFKVKKVKPLNFPPPHSTLEVDFWTCHINLDSVFIGSNGKMFCVFWTLSILSPKFGHIWILTQGNAHHIYLIRTQTQLIDLNGAISIGTSNINSFSAQGGGSKNHILGAMSMKIWNSQKAYLVPSLNVHIKFQFPSSIW